MNPITNKNAKVLGIKAEKQNKPSNNTDMDGTEKIFVYFDERFADLEISKTELVLDINNITNDVFYQYLIDYNVNNIVIIHNIESDKVDTRIVDFCRKLKQNCPDIKLSQLDSKDAVKDADSAMQAIKPFSYLDYKTGTTIETALDSVNKATKPFTWYVDDIFPSRGLVVVASEPKLGKSAILLEFAYCLANGIEFWGNQLFKTKTVYIDLDSDDDDTKMRLKYFNEYYGISTECYSDRLLTIRGVDPITGEIKVPPMSPLKNFKRIDFTQNQCDYDTVDYLEDILLDQPDTKVIIIDTTEFLKPPVPRGIEQGTFESALYANLRRFAELHNITLILVTHLTKDYDPKNPFASIRGSVGLQATVNHSITFSKDPATRKIYLSTRTRRGKQIDDLEIINERDITFRPGKIKKASSCPIDERIAEALDELVCMSPKQEFIGTSGDIYNSLSDNTGLNPTRITKELKRFGELILRDYNLKVRLISSNSHNKIIACRNAS